MEQPIIDILEKPFAKADIGKDYSKHDYVKPHLIIRRLNAAFGQDGWQFIPEERIIEHDTIIQFGKIGILNSEGEWIWKHNCGARKCTYIKSTDKRLDVGNDYKSAVSNCLKRCAMLLGVALDLYGDAEHDESLPPEKSTPQPPDKAKQGQKTAPDKNTGNAPPTELNELRKAVLETEMENKDDGEIRGDYRKRIMGKSMIDMGDPVEMQKYLDAMEEDEEDYSDALNFEQPNDHT